MNLSSLRERVKSGDIDTVLMVFPDALGRLLGKRFAARFFLDQALPNGTHACNYLLTVNIEMDPLDGFKVANWEKGFGDFALKADLSTLRTLPWQPGAALVLCDYVHPDGALVREAPRSVLRNQLERLAKAGWDAYAASELEFFLFNQAYHEIHAAQYRGLVPSSDYRVDYQTCQLTRDEPLFRTIRNSMSAAGVPIECSKGEWGRGQHEINFIYDRPLEMADRHCVFKQGVKEMAAQAGKSVTFMAKWQADEVGSSCHVHLSLWRRGKNAFWDPRTKSGTRLFRQFLGGLLKYSPEFCYFFAPTINSYKRFQPGSWAPTRMAWSHDNRTVGFRVVGEDKSFRVENRMPGADANPYLSFAAMLAAGMAGIEQKLDCGEPYQGNAYVDARLEKLPSTLNAAAEMLAASRLARSAFGNEVVDFYAHAARCEVHAFQNAVTDWERVRYFERI